MKKVKASAPGKLILFGEHAVVYGYPCIVTAVDQRMRVSVSFNGEGAILVRAPQVGLDRYHKRIVDLGKQMVPKQVRFIEVLVKNFYEAFEVDEGLDIVTESDFSANFGFGSSAAVTVALAKALSGLYELDLSYEKLFDVCFKTVLDVQGVGSGFDIAAAVFGGTLYFIKGKKKPDWVKCPSLQLVVGYTGIKADTPTIIRQVAEYRYHNIRKARELFEKIAVIVEQAKGALETGKYERVGELMDSNQKLLHKLGVSSKELDDLIGAAKQADAFGAKLSGAGGGDNMIAVVDRGNREPVEQAIKKTGGKVLKVGLGAKGVRVEK